MPITPLHFGVLAPVNHWLPGKVSLVSFTLVNLWIDLPSIMNLVYDTNYPPHGASHGFVGAMLIALAISSWALISRKLSWVWGAYLAALSHILLDGLVHPEMQPFDWMEGNPLYMGLMEPLSLALVPFMVWFIAQTVSVCSQWARQRRQASQINQR